MDPLVVPPVASVKGKPKVLIAMPWYKTVNPRTSFSVMGLVDRTRTALMLNFGDAFIAHARNKCAENFLKSDLEWMLMVDDDVILPFGDPTWFNAFTGFNLKDPFASFHTLDRLMSHGKTLIGGMYWGRNPTGRGMYSEAANVPTEAAWARKGPYDQIKETRWVATGCLLVNRQVFLDIEKKFPLLARGQDGNGGNWFTSSEHTLTDAVAKAQKALDANAPEKAKELLVHGMASVRASSGLGMGEDVAFCVRAKQAGHPAFVDLGLTVGHVGDCTYGPKNTKG